MARLSGYTSACLRFLKENHHVELLVVRIPPSGEAPFDASQFDWIDQLYDRRSLAENELETLVNRFEPQAVVMTGWFDQLYLKLGRTFRRRGVPVVAGSDAQWTGNWRQRIGGWLSPWLLKPAIDVIWVTGERQRQLAMHLGYSGAQCWSGYYACDWNHFAAPRPRKREEARPAFLYVGRYLPRKGLDTLLEAYRYYRSTEQMPWDLYTAGAGELEDQLNGEPGVHNLGFIQPDALPELLGSIGAFVLPSRREPWGVAVQEAAAAGLPLICSDVCGAAVHLLRDGFNGYSFATGNAGHLARCLQRVAHLNDDQWAAMSRHSYELSQQYTPQIWADTLMRGLAEWPDQKK